MDVYARDNKKMLNMLILEILKKYTDADHRLTQQEIIGLLKLNYGTECDRHSIRNNIRSLKDMGYEIAMERDVIWQSENLMMWNCGCLLTAFYSPKICRERKLSDSSRNLKDSANATFTLKSLMFAICRNYSTRITNRSCWHWMR